MNTLASAFGSKFAENKDRLRIRTFDLGGHTFKVKVPLTVESELMQQRIRGVDDKAIEKYYIDLSKPFLDNKTEFEKDEKVKFLDDDILINDVSLKETARNKAITENRILELVKLLVPEADDFDMSTVTYDMVEELFPFAIQLQLVESITEVISPSYKVSRGK